MEDGRKKGKVEETLIVVSGNLELINFARKTVAANCTENSYRKARGRFIELRKPSKSTALGSADGRE